MFSFDVLVHNAFSGIDSPFLNTIFYGASWLFNAIPFFILLALTTWLISRYYNKKEAAVFFIAPAVAGLMVFAMKYLVGAARPLGGHIYVFGSSFPSWHAAVATAYFLMVLHFIKHAWSGNKSSPGFEFRYMVHYAFCIVCPLFVGVSRLYLGVHWLSDVVGGYVIGALVVYCTIRFLEFKPKLRLL